MSGGDDAGDLAVGTEHQNAAGCHHRLQWELYNVREDPTQFNELASKMPAKVKEMQALFYSEAKKYDVLPHHQGRYPFRLGPHARRLEVIRLDAHPLRGRISPDVPFKVENSTSIIDGKYQCMKP